MNNVKFIETREIVERENEFTKGLSPDERQKYESLWPKRRAHEWLAGRIAAKLLVQKQTGQDLRSIEISNIEDGPQKGRPYFGSWYLSISHSNGIAGAAISKCPIGLDIELIKLRIPMEKIAFSSQEVRTFENLGARQRAAFTTRRWTELEAIVKYNGTGFRQSFASIVLPENAGMKQGQCTVDGAQHYWTLVSAMENQQPNGEIRND